MEIPTPRNQPLFDLMAQDHGLTLTVSECDDIEEIVARMQARDRRCEPALSAGSELGGAPGSVDWRKPLPELEGSFPVVLYFGNEADREEFIEEVRRAKPGMKAVPLPESPPNAAVSDRLPQEKHE